MNKDEAKMAAPKTFANEVIFIARTPVSLKSGEIFNEWIFFSGRCLALRIFPLTVAALRRT